MKDNTNPLCLILGSIVKSSSNSFCFTFMLIVICLSLLCVSNCQISAPQNKYTNCSSLGTCTNCWNEFICLDCSTQSQMPCCPKYCKKCSNNQICNQCELGFAMKNILGRNWTICAYNNRVDYNRDPRDESKCVKGYFLQSYTNFCEKCPLNCQSCFDSVNCQKCPQGYQFKNGICIQQQDQQEEIEDNQSQVVIVKQCTPFQEIFDPALASGIIIGSCCLSCCKKIKKKFKKKELPLNDEATIEFNEQIQSSKDQKQQIEVQNQPDELKQQDHKSSKQMIKKEINK